MYWKYGKPLPQTRLIPSAVISSDRVSISLTLSDGALADEDGTANGVITDSGGPGVPLGAEGIPTLSEWTLVATSLLLLAVGAPAARKRLGVAGPAG